MGKGRCRRGKMTLQWQEDSSVYSWFICQSSESRNLDLLFNSEHDVYSKTSNNGPSEKRTTSVQRTAHLPPIDFTIELIHFEPPRSGHLSTPNNGH